MYTIDNKETLEISKLYEELESQYGPAVAQDIIDRINKNGNVAKAPDYMDVKAMSELQERFRAQAMMAVWRLKTWRKGQAKLTYQENLIQMEGAFLQRQCEDAIKLYRQSHTAYYAMYREALVAFAKPSYIINPIKAGAIA